MKKTFVFLLSTLFLFSTTGLCFARGGGHGERPPENGQSQSRGMRSPAARARGNTRSMTRESATDADSGNSGETGSFKGQKGDKGQFDGFGRHRGMNPPPPPLGEDGTPIPPPDEDGNFGE